MHVSDWYPTLLHAGRCSVMNGTQQLDGFDQWETITSDADSPRSEILHNIDPLYEKVHPSFIRKGFDTSVHAAIRVGNWKLLTGNPGNSNWTLPPEADNIEVCDESKENCPKLKGFDKLERQLNPPLQLFNIVDDPYESKNLARTHPDVVDRLLARLARYNSTAVPVYYPPSERGANPELLGGFWGP